MMNRAAYYNYIEERLTTLCLRIETRGKLNILDYHLHSENFYRDFFNKLYGWSLENLNAQTQNVEAIDLVDKINKIIIQVSATNTKTKIENALSKPILSTAEFSGYTFKFISIAKDAKDIRTKTYCVPTNICFDSSKDIYDKDSILRDIESLTIEQQEIIYDFIRKELGIETDISRLESNLSSVINILSKEDLGIIDTDTNINSFAVDRKIDFNNLISSKSAINDFKIYHNIVNRIYSEFDSLGNNKSLSVLNTIGKEYTKNCNSTSGDELFYLINENVVNRIIKSSNFEKIPQEELEMCVGILVVDAFIRCKVFQNPENYNYAAAR